MINLIKASTPLLAIILSLLAMGYTFAANRVVVVPLGADAAPSGMVSAFNSTTCPTGWQKLANAQGRTIIGLRDGGDLGQAVGVAYSNIQTPSHTHKWGEFIGAEKRWVTKNIHGSDITIIDYSDGISDSGAGFFPLAPKNGADSSISPSGLRCLLPTPSYSTARKCDCQIN